MLSILVIRRVSEQSSAKASQAAKGVGVVTHQRVVTMIRYFLVLAVTGMSLLSADFLIGLIAASEARGPGAVWHGVHFLFSLLTVLAILGIHSIVYTYFMATNKWGKEVVRVYRLPDWFNTHAKQNKKNAVRVVMGSITLIAVTAWLGAAADTRGGSYPAWHLALAAAALVYNLYTFAIEYRLIVSHSRLLKEMKDQADQLRAERYGTNVDPWGSPEEMRREPAQS
jgi:hypothetical protein